ncbi:hypothetical protein C9439_00770, partial [archaeon SCG-AAA382B04]
LPQIPLYLLRFLKSPLSEKLEEKEKRIERLEDVLKEIATSTARGVVTRDPDHFDDIATVLRKRTDLNFHDYTNQAKWDLK